MNQFSSTRLALTVLFLAFVPARGETSSQLVWEKTSSETWLAIYLTSAPDVSVKPPQITIYVKNASKNVKSVALTGDGSAIRFILVGKDGVEHDLRPYKTIPAVSAREESIEPGATWSHSVDLSSDELSAIKSHKVKVSLRIVDWLTKRIYTIQSSPQLLQIGSNTPSSK